MAPTRRVECKVCRGLNDPGNSFCAYCGGSLREQGYKASGRTATGHVIARSFKRLIFVVVILAILAGLYYAVDRLLLPMLREDVVVVTTSTTRFVDTTTTTTAPRTDRVIAGTDRYATAIAISKLGFPKGASAVVLAAGDTYSEAICAAPLATAYGGPVLLVPPEGIGTDLSKEIERLAPSTIFLVGVSRPTRVKTQLRDILQEPTVTNLAGGTPFETAAAIAAEVKSKLGTVTKVVVVPSDSFAEGVAVAPLAAANGWPILLSPKEGDVPKATTNAIEELGATSALVVGTNAKLTLSDVETKTGQDSYETCALLAAYSVENGLSYAHTAIATGEDFPDGLAAAPYLALDKGMLLLAKGSTLPTPILSVFDSNAKAIRTLDFIGLRDLAKSMAVPGATTTTTTAGTGSTAGAATTE